MLIEGIIVPTALIELRVRAGINKINMEGVAT